MGRLWAGPEDRPGAGRGRPRQARGRPEAGRGGPRQARGRPEAG